MTVVFCPVYDAERTETIPGAFSFLSIVLIASQWVILPLARKGMWEDCS